MDLENENDIDTEALQAQIDLSMSFAQDMVSSWVKPHKLPKSSRRNDLELELKEYMKKPPRLGVGATIPTDNQSMIRETARLKGKLTSSKSNREEEDGTSGKRKSPSEDDDEGESRTGAIQKKQRVDPFAGTHGKKKKNQKESGLATPQVLQKITSTSKSQLNQPEESKPSNTTYQISSPMLLKRSKTPETRSNGPDEQPPAITDCEPVPQVKGQMNGTDKPSNMISIPAEPTSPHKKAPPDASHPPSPSKGTSKSIPPLLLKRPLLNLAGPPPESDSEEAPDAPFTSPKKKRKRRRKKKSGTGLGDPQGSAEAPT
ncbi:hypothetical protein BJ165DRAFT_1521306 [Panaeolus papilionaceus]|nr:hypothetical protein BJ165DRAFT_1521306 [Panaeolus papilionaceus]